jgi:hypothetical protein
MFYRKGEGSLGTTLTVQGLKEMRVLGQSSKTDCARKNLLARGD